jgi:hypothetical protein
MLFYIKLWLGLLSQTITLTTLTNLFKNMDKNLCTLCICKRKKYCYFHMVKYSNWSIFKVYDIMVELQQQNLAEHQQNQRQPDIPALYAMICI